MVAVSALRTLFVRCRGIIDDDSLSERRYKTLAVRLNVFCIITFVCSLCWVFASMHSDTEMSAAFYRLGSSATTLAVLLAGLGWYLCRRSILLIKYALYWFAPYSILSFWFRSGCSAQGIGEAFVVVNIITAVFFALGGTNREVLVCVMVSVVSTAGVYAVLFLEVLKGEDRPAWCPLQATASSAVSLSWSACLNLFVQVFQYLAFSAFVKTVRKHERILKQDKEFCSQVLTALVRMDLPALDAMADRTHDGDGGVRQQVAEVVEIMRALSSPQAAEASTDCRSVHSGTHSVDQPTLADLADFEGCETASICRTASVGSLDSADCIALPPRPDMGRSVDSVLLDLPPASEDGGLLSSRRGTWTLAPAPKTVSFHHLLESPPAQLSPVQVAQDAHPLAPVADVPGTVAENALRALQVKDVTILIVNVAGVHAMCSEYGPLVDLRLSRATDLIIRAVMRSRGAVVTFHGGIVLAAFNASLRCSMHAFAACTCALGIRDALRGLSPPCHARIGIHTCRLLVGPVRTQLGLGLNVLGPGVRLCAHLAGLNRTLHTDILLTKACYKAAENQVHARGIDLVHFTDLGRGHEAVEVYELVAERENVPDPEVLYAVDATSGYDLAWQRFCRGDYGAARVNVQQHLDRFPDDAWAQRLQRLAKDRAKKLTNRAHTRTYGVASSEAPT